MTTHDTIISFLTTVQEHYNMSVFMSDETRSHYTPLDILFDEITEPYLEPEDWDRLDVLLTQNFGSGEWAGDTWVTYVNQWEQEWIEGVIDMHTLKSYIHLGLDHTIDALIAERDAGRGE